MLKNIKNLKSNLRGFTKGGKDKLIVTGVAIGVGYVFSQMLYSKGYANGLKDGIKYDGQQK